MLELAGVRRATTSSTSARATAASSSPRRAASARAGSASRSSPTSCERAATRARAAGVGAPRRVPRAGPVRHRPRRRDRRHDVPAARRQPAAAAAPARARAGNEDRLARLGPGRLGARPHGHRRRSRQALGRDKFSRVHLWIVPARVHGRWCADGASLEIVQRFQRFSATLASTGAAAPAAVFDGRIEASTLRSEGFHAFSLQVDGANLRLVGGVGSTPPRTFVAVARRDVSVSGHRAPVWHGIVRAAVALSGARDRPHRRHRPAAGQPRAGRAAHLGPRAGAPAAPLARFGLQA